MTNSPGWVNPRRTVSCWIGFDPREAAAFAVARHSLQTRTNLPIRARGLVLDVLREKGLYTRPTEYHNGRLIDVLSIRDDYDGSLSTEFAISRFLVKELSRTGWALFIDCDFLALDDVQKLFDLTDNSKAVMVVKHSFQPTETVKMDQQIQTVYPRKNWSSCMLLNCDHPANRALTVDYINSVPGRELHAFGWLDDDLIGDLPPQWNFLVGHSTIGVPPSFVHFTDGIPTMAGYEDCEYADDWRAELTRWAL